MALTAGKRITVAHRKEKFRTCGTMLRILQIFGCRWLRLQ